MTDASRSRVTITLGRSGQVVKRAGIASDASYNDSLPTAGTKRSVRDRLGNYTDSSMLHGDRLSNKRQRGYISMSSGNTNGVDDVGLGKGDLRLKLLQKSASRRSIRGDEHNADLREKLAKPLHPPASSFDSRQQMPERKENGFSDRVAHTRSRDNLPPTESFRSSYALSLDRLRQRSPERYVAGSRGLSPQRSTEDIQRRLPLRASDDVRSFSYARKDVPDPSRPVSSGGPYMTNSLRPSASVRPTAPVMGQSHHPSNVVQRSSYLGDEHQTVDGLLQSLGLEKYAIHFKAEEVDMTVLKQMGEHDLKELGIPMGPRKKILLAVMPRSKRQV